MAAAIFFSATFMSVSAAALLCFVMTVQDGDSLRVRCEGDGPRAAPVTVRIHAIDAPEYGQAHGRRARQALRQIVYRQQVQLRCVDTDAYGRRVCQVFKQATARAAAQDVGLALVEGGWAWWYRQYSQAQAPVDRERYEAAEQAARAQRIGLWRDGERAVPPWRWRHTQPR
ncbi:MAG: thermonuclease family protein [Comamonadaceae bacterium]|nr:MAG: thermonuclease family protein [Comamonadaceae bacterium]